MAASTPAPVDLPLRLKPNRCPRCPHRLSELSSHVFETDAENPKPSQLLISVEMVHLDYKKFSTDATSPIAPPAPVNSPNLHPQEDFSIPLEDIPAHMENNRLDYVAADIVDDVCSSTHTADIGKLDSLSLRREKGSETKGCYSVSDMAETSTIEDDGSSTMHAEDAERLDCLGPVDVDGSRKTTLDARPFIKSGGNALEVPCATENLKYLTKQLDKLTLHMERSLASFGGGEYDGVDEMRESSGNTGEREYASDIGVVMPELGDASQHMIEAEKKKIVEKFSENTRLREKHLLHDAGTQVAPYLVAEGINDSGAGEKGSTKKA